jgi:hypothetical protein
MWTQVKREARRLLREDDGFFQFLLPIASALIGKVAGGSARGGAEQRAGGASLQALMPIMMELMKQQQAQSGQQYQMQMQRHQANLPMQDALRSMAMNMLPSQYTQGLPMSPPLSQQPTPALAPIFPPTPTTPPEPTGIRAKLKKGA